MLKTLKKNKKIAGFTLLEILVVISIIGILIVLGASAFSVAQQRGRDARRRGDLKSIQNAFEQYYVGTGNSSYGSCEAMAADQFPSGELPRDPRYPNQDYTCTVGTGSTYCVCAELEGADGNATGPAGAGGTCSFGSGDHYCITNLQ